MVFKKFETEFSTLESDFLFENKYQLRNLNEKLRQMMHLDQPNSENTRSAKYCVTWTSRNLTFYLLLNIL
jgi:hypothetical protein